ncbi:hypothetical protein VTO42DRAFT_2704 [Malbranchea cinnamomea]
MIGNLQIDCVSIPLFLIRAQIRRTHGSCASSFLAPVPSTTPLDDIIIILAVLKDCTDWLFRRLLACHALALWRRVVDQGWASTMQERRPRLSEEGERNESSSETCHLLFLFPWSPRHLRGRHPVPRFPAGPSSTARYYLVGLKYINSNTNSVLNKCHLMSNNSFATAQPSRYQQKDMGCVCYLSIFALSAPHSVRTYIHSTSYIVTAIQHDD